jgi:hypothetical protein
MVAPAARFETFNGAFLFDGQRVHSHGLPTSPTGQTSNPFRLPLSIIKFHLWESCSTR